MLFEKSRNVASSSCGLRPEATRPTMVSEKDETRATEIFDTCTLLPKGASVFDHTGGTYSHSVMMDYPRSPISDMHLGKFPDSMVFQSWNVNLKTETCSRRVGPHLTMQWIKEVEIAKSIGEVMTSLHGRYHSEHTLRVDRLLSGVVSRRQTTVALKFWANDCGS